MEGPVHEAAGVHRQQIAKVVETGFLGGDVGHVRQVGGAPLCGRHPLLHVADRDPEPAIDRAHPLGIAAREIVVERQDVHAATRERVERRGHHGRQGLAFAGQHLDDLPVVQGEGRHELHVERALPEGAAGGLADEREEGHAQRVARLAGASALAERLAPIAHLLVGQLAGRAFELANGGDERCVAAQVEADGRALQATNVVLEAGRYAIEPPPDDGRGHPGSPARPRDRAHRSTRRGSCLAAGVVEQSADGGVRRGDEREDRATRGAKRARPAVRRTG